METNDRNTTNSKSSRHSNSRNGQLNFQPITEGLGFHPFSDGLPYAPVGKTATPKSKWEGGTGAVAAGTPTFVPPATPSNLQRTQTAARPTRISVPVATPNLSAALQEKPEAAPANPLAGLEPRYGIGYLLKRATAYLFDSALNIALCAGALSLALWYQNIRPEALFSPGVLVLCVLFLMAFNWALITAQEIAFGTSVGKRIFRLALQGSGSAIFLRSFFFIPSLAFCGLGLLWGMIDRKKRCWHDVVVDLQPLEIARL